MDDVQKRMLEGALNLAERLRGIPAHILVCGKAVYSPDNPDESFVWSTIYPVTIPPDSIDAEGARLLDLAKNREFIPGIRTNGLGVPGYRLGHFRLANGLRARLALTTRSSIAYVPFDRRAALLLSVEEGEKFIAVLKSAGAGKTSQI